MLVKREFKEAKNYRIELEVRLWKIHRYSKLAISFILGGG